MKLITHYGITHYANGHTAISLWFDGGSGGRIEVANPQRAQFLIDILRNEKPVYGDETGALYTGPEPAGANEHVTTAVPDADYEPQPG